jgi:hypothetical protein
MHLSTGMGFDNQTWTLPSYLGFAIKVGDFNGDGKTDILSAVTYNSYQMHRSMGTGFETRTWSALSSLGTMWVGDYNGDGKIDVALSSGNQILLNLSKGWKGFFDDGWQPSNGWGSASYTWVGDFNGDGKSGIASASGGNVYIKESLEPGVSDLLASLTTGLGITTSVTYKPLTDNTVYTKDSNAVYPYVDVQAPMYVVSSVSTSDGIGGSYLTEYTYAGAKSHQQGGGFLGFRQTTVRDPQTNIRSTTTYRQDYPYHGAPLTTERRTGNNTLIGQSSTTYTDQLLNTGLSPTWHQSLPSHTVESSYELNGNLISTVITDTTYDGYGNPTSIIVNYGGGHSKTTTNTYDNIVDPGRWFLGRLRRSTVTSVTP